MRIRSSVVLLGIAAACQGANSGPAKPDPVAKPTERAGEGVMGAMQRVAVSAVPLPLVQASQQIAVADIQAPWTLTASDGSGLLVTKVDAKAVLQGPLAFTELHLYFHNTEDRVREGTFAITLPPGAAVSRFAMENDGQWMEAELVEKQLARRAYEDNLHRKTDPALLEKAPGNQFTARVFPIPAKADKHLVISFSQELPGTRYTLPLRGLPKVEALDVALAVTGLDGKTTNQTLSQRNWTPDRDFVSDAPSTAEALYAGTTVVAQLSPFEQAQLAADAPKALTILVDTSASRALGFARYAKNLQDLVASIAATYGNVEVQVVAFDQDTHPLYTGDARTFGDAQTRALIERGAAGASDLGRAIDAIAPKSRVVIVTDGVVTAGKEAGDLKGMVASLAKKSVERVDVVLAGGIRDEALASSLVTSLKKSGAVLDLDRGVADVVAGLGEQVLTDVPVEVAGADWVYPKVIKSARASSRTMIYAHMARPTQTIQVTVGGKTRAVGLAGGTPALVERAAATAQIAELEARLEAAQGDERKTLRKQIAERSIAARVISSQTSMLVLETDADYVRYGIDRRSLTDILVVAKGGLEQQRRAVQIAMAEPAKPQTTTKPPVAKNTADKAEKKKAKDTGVDGDDLADGFEDLKKEAEESGELDRGAKADTAQEVVAGDAAAAPMMEPPSAPPPPPPPGVAAAGPATGSGAAAPEQSVSRPEPRPDPRPARVATTTPRLPAEQRAQDSAYLMDEERSYDGRPQRAEAWPPPGSPPALRGPLADIDRAIKRGNADGALSIAKAWHAKDPSDVLALIGMGDALEAKQDLPGAARMYGSLIDLFPGRADLRRFAGERLERIGAQSRALMIDTYRRAVEERPDHMTGHRLLAYALVKDGQHAEAFAAILRGIDQKYPDGRFAGGERVLAEDAGLIGAAYAAAAPAQKTEIVAELAKRGLSLASGRSTRFILYWETDANDVDFHIQDARGGHAFYSAKQLPSGGELYADITTGYGPEEFAIQGTPKAGPYKLSINYYSQGPMGYGMGLLQILTHDGKGTLAFQDRPYVIMNDRAYVDLGTYKP